MSSHKISASKLKSGQALVLVLLSLSVVITLVLYILSRTVTDISISSREEEAVRAFSAAEAGIERALVIGTGSASTIGDANFSASVTSVAEGTYNFSSPLNLAPNDSSTLWFVSHDDDSNLICDVTHPCFSGNTIKVCWGKPGTSSSAATTPAIELSLFYTSIPGDYSTTKIARAALDPYILRSTPNNFSAPDSGTCTIDGELFQFGKTLNLLTDLGIPALADNGLQFARVKMFYNTDTSHKVSFDVNFAGNDTLPSQGILIDSTGTSGEANRRLEVFQSWPESPAIFDYVVFSSSGITK